MLIWIWEETSATLKLYLPTLKLTAFFFPLPPSLSWRLSSTEKCSLSHTEIRELFSHFHHQGTLFFIPMRAALHVTPSSRHNFDTSLLNRENSEVTHCRQIRSWLMNELPVIGSCVCAKISGIATGQILQLARRKCMAEVYSDVQQNDFGERLSLFAAFFFFYQK